ncbi:MAG: NAD-dependent epimerase/dehydratase [Cenarchaeum symbiont of Oopsacas minuta]|nr:NAD-dependent epimerase/dehydratase [Cenarchaeum symbiont of Oopsacas minuta]
MGYLTNMKSNIKIAITGANGFVAKNLRKRFRNLNVQTICIARKNFKSNFNETKIISPKYDSKDIFSLLKNCTTMIHLAGSGVQTVDSDYRTSNVELTQKMTHLCHKARIKRFVYNSGLGVSKHSTSGYFISKYQAEQVVQKSGLDYVIFRPSYIMGKGDALTRSIKMQKKQGRIIVPGSGKYRIQPIYIKDVCNILSDAAILKRYSKKILNLAGPDIVTFQDFVKRIGGKKYLVKANLEAEYRLATRGTGRFSLDDLCIMIGDYTGNIKPLERLYDLQLTRFDAMLDACGLL